VTANEALAVAATAALGAGPNARKLNAKTNNADFMGIAFLLAPEKLVEWLYRQFLAKP
jgi:hypothetical protein